MSTHTPILPVSTRRGLVPTAERADRRTKIYAGLVVDTPVKELAVLVGVNHDTLRKAIYKLGFRRMFVTKTEREHILARRILREFPEKTTA